MAVLSGRVAVLSGRVAVVTGAARGIGLAIATRLASAGAEVFICDLDEETAHAAAASLRDKGERIHGVRVDVRFPEDTDRLAALAAASSGWIDIIVNNAGIVRDGALHKMSDDKWNIVQDVVLRGAFNCLRSCSPYLLDVPPDGRHRKVVNIASINGVYGRELSTNYSAAKAGLIGFSKALAREWAPRKVNVNAVAPGYIGGTQLTTPSGSGTESMREDFMQRVESSIPIGRGGRPEDVASLVGYLASDDADYITGQVVEIHGGLEILKV